MAAEKILPETVGLPGKYVFRSRLGGGSFGAVWECLYGSSRVVAVKVIANEPKEGISSLLEISIMTSYQHPHLNAALEVETAGNKTFIVMEKADRDLWTELGRKLPEESLYRSWCSQLLQGLSQLHGERIVHADIKPDNCLLFGDTLKLTDYTLSVWKVNAEDTFTHSVGTIFYRAPEVLQGLPWNEAVDIWALGCVFYTMATGELLVPYQGPFLDFTQSEEIVRNAQRKKSLSAIVQWRQQLGDSGAARIALPDTQYVPIKLGSRWSSLAPELQELILRMTSFDPRCRPTAQEILRDYYRGYGLASMIKLGTAAVEVSRSQRLNLERAVMECARHYEPPLAPHMPAHLLRLACQLYGRAASLRLPGVYEAQPLVKIESCVWIAFKLLAGYPPEKTYSQLYEIQQMEILICKHLGYRLHVSVSEQLLS